MTIIESIKPTPREIPTQLDLLANLPDGEKQRAYTFYRELVENLFPDGDNLFIDTHSHCGIGNQLQHNGDVIPITPNLSGWVEAMVNYHYPIEEVHKVLADRGDWRITGNERLSVEEVPDLEKATIVADNLGECSRTVKYFVTRVLMEYGIHEEVARLNGSNPEEVTLAEMVDPSKRDLIDERIRALATEDPTGEKYVRAKGLRAIVMTNDVPDVLDEHHARKYSWFPPSARVDNILAKVPEGANNLGQLRTKIEEFVERIIDQQKGVYGAASLPSNFIFESEDLSNLDLNLASHGRITNAYRSFVIKTFFQAIRDRNNSGDKLPVYLFAGVNRKVFPDQYANGGQDLGGRIDFENGYLPLLQQFPEVPVFLKPYTTDDAIELIPAGNLKPNLKISPIWWHKHRFTSMVDLFANYMDRLQAESWIPGDSDAYRVQFFAKIDMTLQAYAAAGAKIYRDHEREDFIKDARKQWLTGPTEVYFPRLANWGLRK